MSNQFEITAVKKLREDLAFSISQSKGVCEAVVITDQGTVQQCLLEIETLTDVNRKYFQRLEIFTNGTRELLEKTDLLTMAGFPPKK